MAISGSGGFGALGLTGRMFPARQPARVPAAVTMPSLAAPLTDPATGKITPEWLIYQTRVSTDIAAIKKQLGIA